MHSRLPSNVSLITKLDFPSWPAFPRSCATCAWPSSPRVEGSLKTRVEVEQVRLLFFEFRMLGKIIMKSFCLSWNLPDLRYRWYRLDLEDDDSTRIHLFGGRVGEEKFWRSSRWYGSSSVCFLSLDVFVAMKCRENDLLLWLTSRCLGLEYRKVAEAKIIIKKNYVIKKNKK